MSLQMLSERPDDRTIILMTACINPNGMSYTKLQDADIRRKDYIEAIRFYLDTTRYKIVFCNNSGSDSICDLFKQEQERIEFLFFDGNNYDKSLGKGYGEFEIIKYVSHHSVFFRQSLNVIKITGRLRIINLNDCFRFNKRLLPAEKYVHADWLSDEERFIDSRCFFASKDFFMYLASCCNDINDSEGYYFEHKLFDVINLGNYSSIGFCIPAHIEGVSGSTLEKYATKEQRKNTEYLQSFLKNEKNTLQSVYGGKVSILYHTIRCVNWLRRKLGV